MKSSRIRSFCGLYFPAFGLNKERYSLYRFSCPGVLEKGVLIICSKFTGENPCRSAISIKLQRNFIEITLRHWFSPVNVRHISKTPFPKKHLDGCLCIQSKCRKIRTRKTPNMDTFHAVYNKNFLLICVSAKSNSLTTVY